jgi:hypothetical protein
LIWTVVAFVHWIASVFCFTCMDRYTSVTTTPIAPITCAKLPSTPDHSSSDMVYTERVIPMPFWQLAAAD